MKYFLWRSLWTVLFMVNMYGFRFTDEPGWRLVNLAGILICLNELFEPRKKNG